MSSITSSAYPVVTISQDGDLFVIVRNGQLVKCTRAALGEYISTLAPNTFLSLSDSPGTYVGQAGKVPAVNIAEDGMDFVAGAANYFVSLLDGPGNFGSNALKIPRVNAGETALEYVSNAFTALADVPATYSGSGSLLLRVNSSATGIEFVSLSSAIPGNNTGGFFDYNHGGGSQSFTGTPINLDNDAAGALTLKTYAPPGISDIWDNTTNAFDFTELALGDEIRIRIDISVTTSSPSQEVVLNLNLAQGSGSDYSIPWIVSTYKSAGVHNLIRYNAFYMGNLETLNNPAYFEFDSDANATVQVNGWYCSIVRRG